MSWCGCHHLELGLKLWRWLSTSTSTSPSGEKIVWLPRNYHCVGPQVGLQWAYSKCTFSRNCRSSTSLSLWTYRPPPSESLCFSWLVCHFFVFDHICVDEVLCLLADTMSKVPLVSLHTGPWISWLLLIPRPAHAQDLTKGALRTSGQHRRSWVGVRLCTPRGELPASPLVCLTHQGHPRRADASLPETVCYAQLPQLKHHAGIS